MKIHPDIHEVLFTPDKIAKRVKQIGTQISKDYHGDDLFLVVILQGAIIFASDLMRQIDHGVKVVSGSMAASSYHKGTVSTGHVQIYLDLKEDPGGKNILIVEDIFDTGRTLSNLIKQLTARDPKSIKVASLLSKPSRRETEFTIDYCGFEIPNKFVVGYGLDFNQRYRELPYVGILKPELYAGC